MADKPPVSRPKGPPKPGGKPAGKDGKGKPGEKKILGMNRRVAVISGIALLAGVAFIIWRDHQAASAANSSTGTTDTGASGGQLPSTDGIQGGGMQGATGTETLVVKLRELGGHKHRPRPGPKPGGGRHHHHIPVDIPPPGKHPQPKPRRPRPKPRRGPKPPHHKGVPPRRVT